MSSSRESRPAARSRIRSLVPAILTILISIMIIRDILVRRWGSPTPPTADVTRRLP
jgi:hypothetical protein